MNRPALWLGLCAAALAVAAPAASAKTTFFAAPGENIGCVIDGKGARCDILDRSWTPPPAPASCPVDYGNGVSVDRHGRAGYTCAGDTVFTPSAEVLEHGRRIERGRFRCASKAKEGDTMRCVNRRNAHGFRLSAQRVKVF